MRWDASQHSAMTGQSTALAISKGDVRREAARGTAPRPAGDVRCLGPGLLTILDRCNHGSGMGATNGESVSSPTTSLSCPGVAATTSVTWDARLLDPSKDLSVGRALLPGLGRRRWSRAGASGPGSPRGVFVLKRFECSGHIVGNPAWVFEFPDRHEPRASDAVHTTTGSSSSIRQRSRVPPRLHFPDIADPQSPCTPDLPGELPSCSRFHVVRRRPWPVSRGDPDRTSLPMSTPVLPHDRIQPRYDTLETWAMTALASSWSGFRRSQTGEG